MWTNKCTVFAQYRSLLNWPLKCVEEQQAEPKKSTICKKWTFNKKSEKTIRICHFCSICSKVVRKGGEVLFSSTFGCPGMHVYIYIFPEVLKNTCVNTQLYTVLNAIRLALFHPEQLQVQGIQLEMVVVTTTWRTRLWFENVLFLCYCSIYHFCTPYFFWDV